MKRGMKTIACALAGAVTLLAATSLRAAPIITMLPGGDVGTLTVQTFSPLTLTSATLAHPYGTPPIPTITAVPSGWAVSFVLNSTFLATANNYSGGEKTNMDGKLEFTITFDGPINLTTNLFETGIYATSGGGTVDVNGGLVVSEADNFVPLESLGGSFSSEVYKPSGIWKSFNQVTGFGGSYTKYKIEIDNTLFAQALASQTPGSAYIAKKDFTLVFTTDGSSGGGPNVPEPASLGMLAIGGMALLARRRKN